MNRIWELRKSTNEQVIRDVGTRSPVATYLGSRAAGDEWRGLMAFDTKTLVRSPNGSIGLAGPVVVGIRLDKQSLSIAPHPMGLVSVLEPRAVFHPNCSSAGGLCLGHPQASISLESILNQVWAGLMFNMRLVNTRPGELINPEAGAYVRANAERFPISDRGLFEEPDVALRNTEWYVKFDSRRHAVGGLPDDGRGVTE